MTEVSFHTGVPDVLAYACRLLRKAQRKGSKVVACAPEPLLGELDRALWTCGEFEFVPHLRLAPGAGVPAHLLPTPIWLVEPGVEGPTHEVLVNLGPDPAPGFEAYARVIEIVGRDEAGARAGRVRWRHYSERGYPITHHRVPDEEPSAGAAPPGRGAAADG